MKHAKSFFSRFVPFFLSWCDGSGFMPATKWENKNLLQGNLCDLPFENDRSGFFLTVSHGNEKYAEPNQFTK